MANKITFKNRFNKHSFTICCNGKPITGKGGDESTARAEINPANGHYALWVYLYIGETKHVCADILANPNDIKPALEIARAFVRHTLDTIELSAPL